MHYYGFHRCCTRRSIVVDGQNNTKTQCSELAQWGPSKPSELRASPEFFSRSLGARPFAAWATRGSLGTRAQQEATRSSLGTRPVDFWSLGLEFSLGFLRRPSSARCISYYVHLRLKQYISYKLQSIAVYHSCFLIISHR